MRIPRIAVLAVSVYLLFVGAWLLLTQKVPSPGFRRILLSSSRRPYAGMLQEFQPEAGYCFTAPVPAELLSDQESASCLLLFENGQEIGTAHSAHEEIRQLGQGRFSHWGSTLYFSTPDQSDPRNNGRRYEVKEVRR